MITTVLTWKEFRAMVFTKIAELVEDSNCSNYTVLGWKHLDVKLILHYRDCDRVFEFTFNIIDEDHTNTDLNKQFEVTSYYTKDYTHEEYMTELDLFSKNWSRREPEQK